MIFTTMMTQRLDSLRPQPLLDSDLHIWRAALNASPDELAYYESLLSPDEHARAERFHFLNDRQRYITGRGILRMLAGFYLDLEPADIFFEYGLYGKPTLQQHALQFNLSHSIDQAIYIFGWDSPLGIDMEQIRWLEGADDLAARYFSKSEIAWLRSLNGGAKLQAFFRLWTCKEAFLKAHGSGLNISLDQVEVPFEADVDEEITIGEWSIRTFVPLAGFLASFAGTGKRSVLYFPGVD
jgi:4'-phosphopantetheinyl transferase